MIVYLDNSVDTILKYAALPVLSHQRDVSRNVSDMKYAALPVRIEPVETFHETSLLARYAQASFCGMMALGEAGVSPAA